MLPQPTGYCTVWPVIIKAGDNHPGIGTTTTLIANIHGDDESCAGHAGLRQMEGDIFLQILLDLQREG